MIPSGSDTIKKLARLMAAPTIDPSERASHIRTVETDIVLPLKGLIVVILVYFFFFSGWKDTPRENGPPFIATFRPKSGPVGTPVVIDGYNFSENPASNVVRFGSAQAVITFASSNQVKAIVPPGARRGPVSII